MRTICTIAVSCVVLMLLMTSPVMAQSCPAQGSGAEGVKAFAETCSDCERGPVITCNGRFSVTLMNVERDMVLNLVKFTYDVYKFPDVAVDTDLKYWVLGLDLNKFELNLAEGKTLSDLFVDCTVDALGNGIDCGLVLPDPDTELDGVRFEATIGDGQTMSFSVILDEMALMPGSEIEEGCALAGTVADDEDIQMAAQPSPGYACISGPVVKEEEAFACPKSFGFWKTHPGKWPVSSLVLGSQTYSQSELLDLLKMPVRGDASVILARQLIAAKLNIANGSDPAPIQSTISSADSELSAFSGKLPYKVKTSTPTGHTMQGTAQILSRYNGGEMTPGCEGQGQDEDED